MPSIADCLSCSEVKSKCDCYYKSQRFFTIPSPYPVPSNNSKVALSPSVALRRYVPSRRCRSAPRPPSMDRRRGRAPPPVYRERHAALHHWHSHCALTHISLPQRTVTPTHPPSGTPSPNTYPTARTKTAASGGGRRWPPAYRKAPGVQRKMSVSSRPWRSSAQSGQQSPVGSAPGTAAVRLHSLARPGSLSPDPNPLTTLECAKRWNDALNPAIDRSGWTPDEVRPFPLPPHSERTH